jgi:phosphatidate phosphatase APP1
VASRSTVILYRSFGAQDKVFVQGRALEDRRIAPAVVTNSRWQNLRAMLLRADANPLSHAVVRVTIGSATHDFTADDEGFFSGWMPAVTPRRLDEEWIDVQGELVMPVSTAPQRVRGRALYPLATPEFLVISDIDDTVLQSRVTNFLRAAQTLAFGNARTRLPFPGVAAFYQALRRGAGGHGCNPMFYVSSSPWNLYDVITQFLELQGIPTGPIMLRDIDINFGTLSSRRHHDHKALNVQRVLNTYPDVPAILIGDSGQQDPEIYHGIVQEFGGRVRAVYIRNVTMNADRSAAINALAKQVLAAGSSLVLADDTLAAARHAAQLGFISSDALPAVGAEKKADEGVTTAKAGAPGVRDAGDEPTPTIVVEP